MFHGELLNNQRVYIYIYYSIIGSTKITDEKKEQKRVKCYNMLQLWTFMLLVCISSGGKMWVSLAMRGPMSGVRVEQEYLLVMTNSLLLKMAHLLRCFTY